MSEEAWAGWLAALMLLTFLISNGVATGGIPFYVSRKIAHFGAAIPIAISPFVFEDMYYILGLAVAFLLILAVTHNFNFFPGFAKKGRWSEIWFPASVALTIAVLWPVNKWAAVAPGLWLSLGDGVTGLVRMALYHREVKGWWGTGACFVVCGTIGALLVQPIWLGVLGASIATVVERYCGDAKGSIFKIDDNVAMPAAGGLVLATGLYAIKFLG